MNRSLMTPRLSSLDVFAGALLVALGVEMQAGCTTEVIYEKNNNGGSGGTGTPVSTAASTSSGQSSSGVVTTTTTAATSTSSTSGFIPGTGECINPMPVIIEGVDVGLDQCAGGEFLRREPVACPVVPPDPMSCCGMCPAGQICDTSGEIACSCVPSCSTDSDCMAGQMCFCGNTGGRCMTAKCNTAADCVAGQQCTSFDSSMGCLFLAFACTTPQDTCAGDKDCSMQMPGAFCVMQADGHRECQFGGCAIGRPFLVDGEARTADVEMRADWAETGLAANTVGLDEQLRNALAQAWEQTAQMEHASIAAFARFALELLSLGAPSDLIMRTNAAMVDETNHARMAFALASAYRGKAQGPGRLAIHSALAEGGDIASFVRRVILEGCVGETVAAVEAGEAAARATDPVVRRTLETIAADEAAHAELAWRTVTWALQTFGADVRDMIRIEMARLAEELNTVFESRGGAWDDELLDHGVVTTNVREGIRRATLKEVVMPCLGGILGIGSRATRCASTSSSSPLNLVGPIRTAV